MNLKLKIRVLESGKSQSAICREVGITDTIFSRVVQGWITPKEEVKTKIASALNCKTEEIF